MIAENALADRVVSSLRVIVEEGSEGGDLRLTELLVRFKALIGLHVLVRQVTQDLTLSSIPSEYVKGLISPIPEEVHLLDFEWMLEKASNFFRAAYNDIKAKDEMLAASARYCLSYEFRGIYTRIRDRVLSVVGYLEIAEDATFDPTAYFLANPDVEAAAKGNVSFALTHFHMYGRSEGRKQRIFYPESSQPRKLFFDGPFRLGFADGATIPAGVKIENGRAPDIEVIAASEMHDARSAYDRDTSYLSASVVDKGPLEWVSAALTLAHFDSALVNLENGFVISDAHLWSDSCFATLLCPGGRTRSVDIFDLDGEFFRIIENYADEPFELKDPAMVACSWASRANYGHWLMNTLLSVFLVRDRLRLGLQLICPPLTSRQRRDLLMLGVPRQSIVETSRRYVRGEIIYPSPLTTQANMMPGIWVSRFFSDIVSRARSTEDPSFLAPELVYISRKGFTQSGRVMKNEDILIEYLSRLGFVCVSPHDLDFSEQIRMMSRAKVIVGQFGAALWNIAFAPPGGTVVEIGVSSYYSNEYLFLSSLKKMRFIRIMTSTEMNQKDAARGAAFSFEAPIDVILERVGRLIG